MQRQSAIITLVAAIAALLGSTIAAYACSCAVSSNEERLRGADLIVEGRVTALRAGKTRRIGTVLVLRGSKGVKEGRRIQVAFDNETTCSLGIPDLNTISRWALIGGPNLSYSSYCVSLPEGHDGRRLLDDYRTQWRRLDEQAVRGRGDLAAQLALADYLGLWHDDLGAMTAYERAAILAPKDTRVHTGLGISLMRLKQFDQADQAFARAISADPSNGRAILSRIESGARAERARAAVREREQARIGRQTSRWPRPVHRFRATAFTGQDLRRLSLTDLDLEGALIPPTGGPGRPGYAEVQGIRAARSDWSDAQIRGVGLHRADLTGANLARSDFTRSRLDAARLDHAKAPNAHFPAASLAGASARNLEAPKANFVQADLSGADLSEANLSGANFNNSDLARASLKGAGLDAAQFSLSDLRGTDLRAASMKDAKLTFAKIDCETAFPESLVLSQDSILPTRACGTRYSLDFSGRDLTRASFAGLDMREAKFTGAKLGGLWFGGADFSRAVIDGVDFSGANVSTDFANASARRAIFKDVIGRPRMRYADFSGAILSGAHPPIDDPKSALILDLGDSGPRMIGADIQRAYITLNFWGPHPESSYLEGLLGAKFKDSVIDCGSHTPRSFTGYDRKSSWRRFIAVLDVARRTATENPTVTLTDKCAKVVDLFLGNVCRKGFQEAGFSYDCPGS